MENEPQPSLSGNQIAVVMIMLAVEAVVKAKSALDATRVYFDERKATSDATVLSFPSSSAETLTFLEGQIPLMEHESSTLAERVGIHVAELNSFRAQVRHLLRGANAS